MNGDGRISADELKRWKPVDEFATSHELRTKFRFRGTYRGLYRVLGGTY